ncbi:MAG: hypothetical protein AAGC55_22420, partial [Myxococcota bacterium]
YERWGVPRRRGETYFVTRNDGLQNQAVLYTMRSPTEAPEPLLDPNTLSADGTVALSGTWPSRDGKYLAYISYRADATGDLCVLNLSSKDSRCLTGLQSAEMQPLWLDRGRSLAVVTRDSLHGNYILRRFPVDGDPSDGQVLLERNMLGAAISPDGRWLAYVPLRPTQSQLGIGVTFASRNSQGLELQRLDDAAAAPVPFKPDLPGLTGFPVFSTDGRHLYFAQYLNDTNGDSAIDGNDHSVLFRVALDPDASKPVVSTWPEQLTSAEWNCRYPAPTGDRLIVTCAHQGSLDIYSLPLAGTVPDRWNETRVRGELHVARNHWTKLVLLARLLDQVKKPAERIAVLRQMVWLHIELREYESAIFYCDQIHRLAGAGRSAKSGRKPSPNSAPTVAWADLMLALAGHRRADIRLTRGQISDRYTTEERQRLAALTPLLGHSDRDIAVLAHLVSSEILDDIGDKAASRARFDKVAQTTDGLRDSLVLHTYAQRAHAIHALRGDRTALIDSYRDLATHPALGTLDRLRFAEIFVEELLRGVAQAERPSLIDTWSDELPADSEIGLMVRVTGWLLKIGTMDQNEVRQGIFELYKQT